MELSSEVTSMPSGKTCNENRRLILHVVVLLCFVSRIGNNTSVGDNTVIHTAGSLPTGIPASVNIGMRNIS
jgi:carbonic anhydrase/acetyltransferase-like protein (isoleucine patch superfamily)